MRILNLILVSALVAAASAVPHHKMANKTRRPNEDYIEWYDCSGQEVGNYANPRDCTRYIACTTGYVSDMACPDCDQNNQLCAGNPYLVWDDDIKRCEWPATTTCNQEPVTTELPVTTTTTTTEVPVTEGTETTEDSGETTTTTTEDPGNGDVCKSRKAGDSCDQEDCEHCGYCRDKMSFYFRCERTFSADPKDPITGVIVHESCDPNLWWNPDLKPPGVEVGGACDEWGNLSPEVQKKYNEDPECVPEVCLWGQEEGDECSGKYWYYNPETHGSFDKRESLKCNGALVWDPATETCRNAEHVEGC